MKKTNSIKQIFSQTNKLILALAMIPLLISFIFYSRYIMSYQNIITNVQTANSIAEKVDEVFLESMWDIVTGQQSAEDAIEYGILDELKEDIHSIKANTSTSSEVSILNVAEQVIETLRKNQQTIIENLTKKNSYNKNTLIMEQVDANRQLLSDILQDFVRTEINIASDRKVELNQSLIIWGILQVSLVWGIFYFSQRNRKILDKKIQEPLNHLVAMSNELSRGNLNYRLELPDTDEMVTLTKSLNDMADNLIQLLEENALKQYHLAQSEIRVLQAQITPHFIYNSLDAILALIEQEKYEQAREMTFSLSDFFRISLSKGNDWITLEREVRHIKDYLTILKIRYGDMLQYDIETPEHLLSLTIPKMILQPLIENAVYHGTKFIRRAGLIRVHISDVADTIIFTVNDNGIGIKPDELARISKELDKGIYSDFNNGYGLYNVNKRILLYYGSKAKVTIDSEYHKGTTVTVIIPKYQEENKYV